ncbi:hypothetical protein FRX31_026699 [Thalictrum thalictroides]|uniref:C2H2-type domain-containing protein n=1 Tax=Thalictrum thalictroides TaxID=46969 RepID=A0A7J6VG06_THATH|nr:hypothetical protein FRX31_026699 [Thalictrum thalictroides]
MPKTEQKKVAPNDPNGNKPRRPAPRKIIGCFKCSYCNKTFTTPQGRGGHCGLVHKKEMADFNKEFQATVNGELDLSLAPPRANVPDLNLPVMDDDDQVGGH